MTMERRTINIPIARIKETGGEAKKLRLLAASIIIKETFEFSTFHTAGAAPSVRVRNLMNVLHCGYTTAKSLMEEMKESPLFRYCADNGVYFAKPLRSRTVTQYGNFKASQSDNVYKLEYDKSNPHTLKEMKKILRRILLVNRIRNRQRATLKAYPTVEPPLKRCVIALRSMAKEIGLSKSSASRYIKQLGNDRIVSKSEIVAECVIPVLNEVTARQWYERHPNKGHFFVFDNPSTGCLQGWQTLGRAYFLMGENGEKVDKRFLHVIYSHKQRISTKFIKKETSNFDYDRFKQLYDC